MPANAADVHRIWRRLLAMEPDEVLVRARQEICKRYDGTRGALGYRFNGRAAARAAAPAGRFFFTDVDRIIDIMRQRFAEDVRDVLEAAERCCEHRFNLLGYSQVDYGPRIDWHLDAVHGKRAPKAPFYKICYLNFDRVGDAKVTWELNRHQHFVTLAMAYRMTGEERFLREIIEQWRSWHTQNPYAVGINWSSSLEVAVRSLSWLWTYFLLQDGGASGQSFRAEIVGALFVNARHIERYLSTYFSPNTHLLGEGVALFFIGALCGELRFARKWKMRGWSIILDAAERQVREDGLHFEQSTYYHVYALDFFLHAVLLARLNEIDVPDMLLTRIEKMLEALSLLARSGVPPKLGDDDGGRLFNPRRNRPEHMIDPLAVGAALLKRPDFKACAREPSVELLWLTGEAGLAEWDRLPSRAPQTTSCALESAGLYCLTAGKPSPQLVIDAGPLGALHGGHGHADALSICLYGDEQLLVDPGTCAYVDPDGKRTHYRGTCAHNTLQVDGLDQAETRGPFGWASLPATHVDKWICGTSFTLFAGSHLGYRRLREPVTHGRFVFCMDGNFWLIRDTAEGAGTHRLDLRWHLGPHLAQKNARTPVFLGSRDSGIAIVTAEEYGWTREVRTSWWSPVYGETQSIPLLRFSSVQAMPAQFVTVLQPIASSSDAPGTLSLIACRPETPLHAYRYRTERETYFIIFAKPHCRWNVGPYAGDAEFLCVKTSEGGSGRVVLCNGTWAAIDGHRVVDFAVPVSHCEVVLEGG